MSKLPQSGDIYLASLPERTPAGHEQQGMRPIVVIARPVGSRFPMIIAVPLTSQAGYWREARPSLYPILRAEAGGIAFDSTALLDHIQGLDERRLVRKLGALTPEEYSPVEEGLRGMLNG